jgi:hypothetical protein
MNDPLSSLHAPPPRYLLESDSSDEEGQGAYPETSRRPPRPTASLNPSIELNLNFSEVKCAVVGVGQAGLYLIRKAGAHRAVGDITTERGLVGRLYAMDEGVMVFMEEGESNEGISEVAVTLMNSLKARSWYVSPCDRSRS